jgi:hypothetical protein
MSAALSSGATNWDETEAAATRKKNVTLVITLIQPCRGLEHEMKEYIVPSRFWHNIRNNSVYHGGGYSTASSKYGMKRGEPY